MNTTQNPTQNPTQNQRGNYELNSELKPCGCSCPLTWAYETYFMGIRIAFTIGCGRCGKYITRLNKKAAIKAWNKYWNRRATDERAD